MKYDDGSIKTMRPLEAIRKRLGMYISGNDNDAVHHVIKEIISNSIDEYLAGHGNLIEVEVNEKENWVKVKDYARGIPHGKLDEVWTKTHSSGKVKGENQGAYGASGGLNGIGGKVATATGKVEVISIREGVAAKNWYHYEKMGKLELIKTKEKNGTFVKWSPDDDVFTDKQISSEKVEQLLISLSYITAGLTFKLKNGQEKTIKANGIEQFFYDNITEQSMWSPIMKFSSGNEYLYVECAMVWGKHKGIESSFVNLIPTIDGGTHVSALKTVLTREMNKFLNSDLKGDEIRQGWNFILSVKTTEEPMFKGQQKSALNMPSLNSVLNKLYKDQIELLLSQHKDFFEKLKEMVEKTREKEQAISQIREVVAKSKTTNNPLPQKLKPALNKNGAELFICEGDSAAGSLIYHRDKYKHAIMALKGKPINVKKSNIEKVLKNQEIQDLIIALGGFGETFDSKKCSYDKIILMADSDSDGSHIELLLLTFFYEFYPQLIRDGKIYTILTPLYNIKNGQKVEYVFTEKEMEEKRKSISKSSLVSRNKGLGEIEPEILSEFTFSKNRKLVQLKMDDEETVANLLESFMGVDAADRREFVE